jgi:hypothetical protein
VLSPIFGAVLLLSSWQLRARRASTGRKFAFQQPAISLVATMAFMTVDAKGFSIPFDALDFEDRGNKEYVFFCLGKKG